MQKEENEKQITEHPRALGQYQPIICMTGFTKKKKKE